MDNLQDINPNFYKKANLVPDYNDEIAKLERFEQNVRSSLVCLIGNYFLDNVHTNWSVPILACIKILLEINNYFNDKSKLWTN